VNQRLLLVAALVLAAALAGTALLLLGSGARESAARAAEIGVAPDRAPSDAAVGVASASDASRAAAAELAAKPAGPSASESASLPAGEGLEVIAVDRETEQPIGGARLAYLDLSRAEAKASGLWFRNCELDARVAASGRTYVADERGFARVPKPEHAAIVCATYGDRWGYAQIEESADPPVKVALSRDADIEVRVVDETGRPAGGVTVALRHRWGGDGFWDPLRAVTAASDGRAVLRHAGFQLDQDGGFRRKLAVALAAVLAKPVEVAVDPDALPAEPIVLTLTATGECEVRVVDARGQPLTEPVDVSLRLQAPGESPDKGIERWTFAGLSQEQVRGTALFRHVEPGRDLVATVQRPGAQAQHHAFGPGPNVAGQRATLTVRLGEGVAILSGRALDERGEPLRATTLRASTSCRVPGQRDAADEVFWDFETDGDGRFEIDTQVREGDTSACELTVFTIDKGGAQKASATRALPGALLAGVHAIGDFLLQPAPLLASGTVVDADGNPVRRAMVTPSRKQTWGEGEDQYWWEALWALRGATEADGSFTLRGRVESDSIALTATSRDEKLKGPHEIVAPGATGVVLRLTGTGVIAGVVLLDEEIQRGEVTVQAQRQSQDGRDPGDFFWTGASLERDGSFAIKDLRPGTYDLSLQIGQNWADVRTVSGIEVAAGETVRDPRVDPLDLRGSQRVLRLTITDADGNPIPQGNVVQRDPDAGEEERTQWLWFQGGEMTVTYTGAAVDLDVSSPGYLSVHVSRAAEDRTVVLRRAPRVRLSLARGLRVPQGCELSAQLRSAEGGESHGWFGDGPSAFDANGSLTTTSPAVGRVVVELMFSSRSENTWTSTSFDDGAERVIEVLESAGEQVFEVVFDQAKLDLAAAQFVESLARGE
jgi:hypothetical protein